MLILPMTDELAVSAVRSIHSGSIDDLARLLSEHAGLESCVLQSENASLRTLLHVVTDWPGYFPLGPTVVRMLVDAGADPDQVGASLEPSETALHWAASTDDLEVAVALIDCGADIEAPGASIAGGPPLDNAVGYGCWNVARLLVDRGARVDRIWQASALGLRARFDELVGSMPLQKDDLDEAFWQSCHGGQRRMAEHLLVLGADINATPGYSPHSPIEIAANPGTRRDLIVEWLRQRGATENRPGVG